VVAAWSDTLPLTYAALLNAANGTLLAVVPLGWRIAEHRFNKLDVDCL
jgi:hypothetical protein